MRAFAVPLALLICLGQAGTTSAFIICLQSSVWSQGNVPGNVLCNPFDNSTYRAWGGMGIHAVNMVAQYLGWIQDQDRGLNSSWDSRRYAIRCLNGLNSIGFSGSKLATYLSSGNITDFPNCAMIVNSPLQTPRLANNPEHYITPLFKNPVSVLTYTPAVESKPDFWAFLKPYTWDAWCAFLLTIVGLSFVVFLVEQLGSMGFITVFGRAFDDLRVSVYRNMLCIFNQDVMGANALASQVMIIAYLMLVLTFVSTYTANLASFLALTAEQPQLNSLADFKGKVLGWDDGFTNEILTTYCTMVKPGLPLAGYNQQPTTYHGQPCVLMSTCPPYSNCSAVYECPWRNWTLLGGATGYCPTQTSDVIPALRNGTYDAFVAFTSLHEQSLAKDSSPCDFQLIPSNLAGTSTGFVVHNSVPRWWVDKLNEAEVWVRQSGVDELLRNEYIHTQSVDCSSNSAINTSNAVSFSQLAGLWIILAAAFGFALLVTALRVSYKVWRIMRDNAQPDPPLQLEPAGSPGPGGLPEVTLVFLSKEPESDEGEGRAADQDALAFHHAISRTTTVRSTPSTPANAHHSSGNADAAVTVLEPGSGFTKISKRASTGLPPGVFSRTVSGRPSSRVSSRVSGDQMKEQQQQQAADGGGSPRQSQVPRTGSKLQQALRQVFILPSKSASLALGSGDLERQHSPSQELTLSSGQAQGQAQGQLQGTQASGKDLLAAGGPQNLKGVSSKDLLKDAAMGDMLPRSPSAAPGTPRDGASASHKAFSQERRMTAVTALPLQQASGGDTAPHAHPSALSRLGSPPHAPTAVLLANTSESNAVLLRPASGRVVSGRSGQPRGSLLGLEQQQLQHQQQHQNQNQQ